MHEVLLGLADNPVVRLNHAVAVAMVDGPVAGLTHLDALDHDDRITQSHRWHAVRAHLLHQAGDLEGAEAAYRAAAERTTKPALRRYLHDQATCLHRHSHDSSPHDDGATDPAPA